MQNCVEVISKIVSRGDPASRFLNKGAASNLAPSAALPIHSSSRAPKLWNVRRKEFALPQLCESHKDLQLVDSHIYAFGSSSNPSTSHEIRTTSGIARLTALSKCAYERQTIGT